MKTFINSTEGKFTVERYANKYLQRIGEQTAVQSFIKIKCFAHFVNQLKACCPFVTLPLLAKNRLPTTHGVRSKNACCNCTLIFN